MWNWILIWNVLVKQTRKKGFWFLLKDLCFYLRFKLFMFSFFQQLFELFLFQHPFHLNRNGTFLVFPFFLLYLLPYKLIFNLGKFFSFLNFLLLKNRFRDSGFAAKLCVFWHTLQITFPLLILLLQLLLLPDFLFRLNDNWFPHSKYVTLGYQSFWLRLNGLDGLQIWVLPIWPLFIRFLVLHHLKIWLLSKLIKVLILFEPVFLDFLKEILLLGLWNLVLLNGDVTFFNDFIFELFGQLWIRCNRFGFAVF